ncbi:MAG TPA: acyltransferase [Roseateles sp.]
MRLTLIEASRAVAALAVVLMHTTHLMRVDQFSGHVGLQGMFDWGYVGVDFFFVLSGFIITFVHHRELGAGTTYLRSYAWKRFVRVFPIYWCVLLLSIVLSVATRLAAHRQPLLEFSAADIPGTLFLLIGGGEPLYVGVAWSLQFEVMFYASFCLLLLHRGAGMLAYAAWGALVLLMAADALPAGLKPLTFNVLSPHCAQFLLGVVTALAALKWQARLGRPALLGAIALFALATVYERWDDSTIHSAMGRLLLGLASAMLLFVMVNLERGGVLRAPRLLAQLGAVSYSLYLAHCVFINIALTLLAKLGVYRALPEVVIFVFAFGVAVAGGWWLGHKVELPLVGWLRRRVAGRSRQEALATP